MNSAGSAVRSNLTIPGVDSTTSLEPRLMAGSIGFSPLPVTCGLKVAAIDPRVRLAEAIMYNNLGRTLTLDDLARRTGVSASRLSHLFKGQVGVSPKQYLKHLRLRRARYLLETSLLSVKEVAGHVGLTAGALIKEFRRAYGASPQRYRHALRTSDHESYPVLRSMAPDGRAAVNAAGLAYE